MTHDDARAQVANLFQGNPSGVQPNELRAHLKTCDDCRGLYDQTAALTRRLHGKPDEMCPEELVLFAPELPALPVVPLFRTGPTVALALSAGLAALVFWVALPKADNGFTARGVGEARVATPDSPSLRVLCSHQGTVSELSAHTCITGDRLLFAMNPRGSTAVGVVVGNAFVGGMNIPAGMSNRMTPLPWSAPWRPNIAVMGLFGTEQLSQSAAEACAQGTCPAGITVVTVEP